MPKRKLQRRKNQFFSENYRESIDYIKESKMFIYSVVFIFFFFALIGFFIPVPPSLNTIIVNFIENLIATTKDMSASQLITFIFFNNVQSSLLGMLFGVFFGVFSVFTTLVNGYLLGFVAKKAVSTEGILILWKLFPHGIFELPALFISLGLGIKLGTTIFQKNSLEKLKNYLIKSVKVFLFVIIPLLFIAAIIEGTLIALLGG